MSAEKVKASVDVRVESTVYVTVQCEKCGEKLAIASIENGGKFQEDEIFVYVKPHTCPKEEETSA